MFKPTVTLKALVIGALILTLLIPLSMLRELVSERMQMRAAAYDKVAQSWGGQVVAPGPILVVPAQRDVVRDGKYVTETIDVHFLPNDLTFAVDLRMQKLSRRIGLYEVPVYLTTVRATGQVAPDTIARWQQSQPSDRLQWSAARVLLPMQQTRELRSVQATMAGQSLRFVPGAGAEVSGIAAPLALHAAPTEALHFDVSMSLGGSRAFSFLPLGSETRATMTANWPHPSFSGAFAPTQYAIDSKRFTAEWNVLELNRSYGSAFLGSDVNSQTLAASATGVDIFQSVDIYQRGERAIKYALVFIALTFLTFFAWEQVGDMRLHPLQYLLLGLALSVFYLLLIAFTEHVSFAAAYVIAAGALVCLIGIYVTGALHSVRRGGAVAAALSMTYAFLYGLVLSEDYALLLGAIVVFGALAAVMTVTRKIDWYA